MSENIIQTKNSPVLTNKLTGWISFKQILEDKMNLNISLRNEDDLEKEADKFNEDTQNTAWECTPEIKRLLKGCNYPEEIRMLVIEKSKGRTKWFRTRAPQDKRILNNLAQQLKRKIKDFKSESINSYMRELSNDSSTDYSLWKLTKMLKRSTMQILPIKKQDGTWARTSEQKADCFAFHLKIFQEQEEDKLEEIVPQEDGYITLATPREVSKEINNIKPRKTPGSDNRRDFKTTSKKSTG